LEERQDSLNKDIRSKEQKKRDNDSRWEKQWQNGHKKRQDLRNSLSEAVSIVRKNVNNANQVNGHGQDTRWQREFSDKAKEALTGPLSTITGGPMWSIR